MPRSTRKTLAAAGLAAALGGCDLPARNADIELLWPERQAIFRVDSGRGQVEAFSIRGGIAPLGKVQLPARLCPERMALDAERNTLWLWSADGGVAIHARSLSVQDQWHSGMAASVPVPARLIAAAHALPPAPACLFRARMAQAPTERAASN